MCHSECVADAATNSQDDDGRAEPLTDRAVRHLEDLIFAGQVQPGSALPSEAELASELGISRLTVREAVRNLSARGLLEVRQGRRPTVAFPNAAPVSGFFTAALRRDPRALLDLLEVRMAIEVHAAQLAATQASRTDLTALELSLESMYRAEGEEALNLADVRFHAAVAAASGNQMLSFLVEGMEEPLHSSRLESLRGYLVRGKAIDALLAEHRAVFDAISSRDPDAAAAAMRSHLVHTRHDLRTAISRPIDLTAPNSTSTGREPS